ncbi:hypothetical protein [Hymenobacter sp. IS2118]|uniref:hypothetical protein n=1 Tax=Hymenobacter sp. IS2118 TaxID=1505605 RepID=UPI00054E995F|nr:hypothetical protein [Hymenobacter sp. IS2118]
MQLSEENQRTLLIAANQAVEEYASYSANSLFKGAGVEIAYPPNGGFTPEEAEALKLLQGNAVVRSALRKVLADCAAGVVFDLFNMIDGTTEPKQGGWSQVMLGDKPADWEDQGFLHDEFFAAYWDWRDIRPVGNWRLDLLP